MGRHNTDFKHGYTDKKGLKKDDLLSVHPCHPCRADGERGRWGDGERGRIPQLSPQDERQTITPGLRPVSGTPPHPLTPSPSKDTTFAQHDRLAVVLARGCW
jgi:hypothetical protein